MIGILEGLAMDNAPKCPVSGKRKYATEGAALATAKHQVATGRALGTSRLPLQLVPRLAPYEKNGKNRQGSLMIQRGVQSGGGVNPTGNVRTYASAFRTDPNRSGLKSPNLQALEIRK